MATTTPLPSDLGRAGWALETGIYDSTPGSVVNVSMLVELDAAVLVANVEREIQRNSKRDNAAPLVGSRTGEASFAVHLGSGLTSELGELLKAALGEEIAASALTFGSASTNVSVTASAGTLDNIVELIEQTTGIRHRRPGTVSGDTLTFAIKPPASLTFVDVNNASDTSGKAFRTKADIDEPTTFQVLVDKSGHTGERPVKLTGAAINTCKLTFAMEQTPRLAFGFDGGRGEEIATSSGLADTSPNETAFLSDYAAVYLQSSASPTVGVDRNISAFEAEFAHEVMPRKAAQGATSGVLPLSNVVGFIRGNFLGDTITLTIEDGNVKDWHDLQYARTPLSLFLDLAAGNAGDTAGARAVSAWWPEVRVTGAELTEVDGRDAVALTLTATRASGLEKAYLSIFGG